MEMPTHIVAVGGFVENEQDQISLVKTRHGGRVFQGGQGTTNSLKIGTDVTEK